MLQAPPSVPAHLLPGSALGPIPAPEPLLHGSPFRRYDVVQILDPDSRNYGGFLIVGDVMGDKVHGYFLTEGRQRQFVTVRIQFCWHLGTSRVRLLNPCSPVD